MLLRCGPAGGEEGVETEKEGAELAEQPAEGLEREGEAQGVHKPGLVD